MVILSSTKNMSTSSCTKIQNAVLNDIETEYFKLENSDLLKLIYHFSDDGKNCRNQKL